MKFKLSSHKRPSAIERRKKNPRSVVMDGIDVQIAMIKAQAKGEDFTVPRERYVDVVENGETKKIKKTVQSRPKQWWWQDDNLFFTEIRYGSSHTVELEVGKPSVEAGKSIQDVVKVLEEARRMIGAGELDQQISDARKKASRKAKL